jgi:hypothetical protein
MLMVQSAIWNVRAIKTRAGQRLMIASELCGTVFFNWDPGLRRCGRFLRLSRGINGHGANMINGHRAGKHVCGPISEQAPALVRHRTRATQGRSTTRAAILV